jgi:cyclic dehypoxanthinyl futalosine synthase
MNRVLEKVVAGERLAARDALRLFRSRDLTLLAWAAHRVRLRLHPEPIVTYVVDRNINYSNVCVSQCAFCAFRRPKGHAEAYLLSREELREKIAETVRLGGTQILLQGGLHPDLPLDFYCDMLRWMKEEFVDSKLPSSRLAPPASRLHLHAFSPPEIVHFARLNQMTVREVIEALREAGLDSIPGGGAEILSERCRTRLSPRKCSVAEWLDVMRTAHGLGMRTSATMMLGHIETLRERVEHLEQIRRLQDETGGPAAAGRFTAFIPWTYQPENTAPPVRTGLGGNAVGGYDYLRTLAISRLYLDNVPNVQASWVTQGAKIAQVALYFGANDLGSTMIEENVVRAAGCSFRMERSEMERIIRDAGFTPRTRNFFYEVI